MALKEVANTVATLIYQAPVTGAPATFTGAPSTKMKAGGNFVHLDQVQVTIPAGVTDGTCTTNAPGIGNMSATAVKVSAEGKKVIRKEDSLTVNAIPGVLSGGGACTLNVTVNVGDAGQTKVKAE